MLLAADAVHNLKTIHNMKLEPIDKQGAALLMPQDEKARRRSNTAPNGNPCITADELSQGVTIEQLQSLPVPVLAYQTQVTIHGQFPPVSPLCAGYKLLTRNANGSLGVRYAGIDAGKKRTIAKACRLGGSKWGAILDSQGLTMQRCATDTPEGRELIAAIPSGIYGGAGVFRCTMSGRIYAVVSIGAIRAADLWNVIAYFSPGMASPEAIAAKELEHENERKARNDQYAIERNERAINAAKAIEEARLKVQVAPLPATFTPSAGDSFRILGMSYDGTIKFRSYTLAKRGPLLCIVREGEKGRKVDDTHRQAWKKAAAAGLMFPARI